MNKIAVIFWSQTGNTEQMAQAVAAGADALVMGTALLRAEDPAAVVRACRALECRT